MMELVDHVRLRRPEAARERDELRGRDVLRAQREHLMVVERALDFGERAVVQVPRDVEARRFDPETRGQRIQLQHGVALLDPVRARACASRWTCGAGKRMIGGNAPARVCLPRWIRHAAR